MEVIIDDLTNKCADVLTEFMPNHAHDEMRKLIRAALVAAHTQGMLDQITKASK